MTSTQKGTRALKKEMKSDERRTGVVHGPLPLLEISLYTIVWVLAIAYSMYSLFKASEGKLTFLHQDSWGVAWVDTDTWNLDVFTESFSFKYKYNTGSRLQGWPLQNSCDNLCQICICVSKCIL